MSEHELMPAIDALDRRVTETERKANDLLNALNILRADAGLPPRPPGQGGGGGADAAAVATQIKPDTFFAKKQQTAIREYLEMRRAQGQGPAKPREIYEALVSGGFRYEAKDAETAMVGLRALLRKRTNVFVKVGKGAYGLVSWYPDLKPKIAIDDLDLDTDAETADDVVDDEKETADASKASAA